MERTDSYYVEKIKSVLGNFVTHVDVLHPNTPHPLAHIQYRDYKPQPEVRKELHDMMPELEIEQLERDFSNEALNDYFRMEMFSEDVKVVTPEGPVDIMAYMWSKMYDLSYLQFEPK